MIYFITIFIAIALPGVVGASETVGVANEASASALGTLGLDWKLFVAQLINFSVIFLVLWRWVFKPIGQHLEERTQKIEQSLADAEDIQKEKKNFELWKAKETQEANAHIAKLLTLAKADAEQLKADFLTRAKSEEQRLQTEGRELLERERKEMLQDAKQQLAELVVAATEKLLREKLTDKKDHELAETALRELEKEKIKDSSE